MIKIDKIIAQILMSNIPFYAKICHDRVLKTLENTRKLKKTKVIKILFICHGRIESYYH